MIPLPAILSGLNVLKSAADLFKGKGKTVDTVHAALDTATKFLGEAKQDPETAKLLADHELALEEEYTKQAKEALGVMNTEAASEDPVVRRARPMLMYVGYTVILCQMVIFPILHVRLADFLPQETIYWFYTMFASGYLGYGVLRSADKHLGNLADAGALAPKK